MKTSKTMLKPVQAADALSERFSFRVQAGVEIYEHEYFQTEYASENRSQQVQPRLIVEEKPASQLKVFLSKKRSEIDELMQVLKGALVS